MPDCGAVFAATGETHRALARLAARSLRATNPNLAIDLYTETDARVPEFDRVHALEDVTKRPKFEALLRSRFDRTLYLDADVEVLADLSDVFALLDRFDVAAAHCVKRNTGHVRRTHRTAFGAAFPQVNTGVLAIRKGPESDALLQSVIDEMRRSAAEIDQPIFREMLWTSEARLAILPPEYNFKDIRQAALRGWHEPAPRILHESDLHRKAGQMDSIRDGLRQLHPDELLAHIDALRDCDRALAPETEERRPPLVRYTSPDNRRRAARKALIGNLRTALGL